MNSRRIRIQKFICSIAGQLERSGTPDACVGLQFTAALKEAFAQIVYPSINSALRPTGIDLAFAGNQSGEATTRHTLEGAPKFTTKIDDDSFRTRAEARLFGPEETKVELQTRRRRQYPVGYSTNPRRLMTSSSSASAAAFGKKAITFAAARSRGFHS